jgi:phosphoribosylglycinamide formyltransferase-1
MKVVAFISGAGTTVAHLIQNQDKAPWRISGIIADRQQSEELKLLASRMKINNSIFEAKDFAAPEKFNQAVFEKVRSLRPDVILLLGYLRKVGGDVVAEYKGRIFNTHPSLLPKYGGKGMFGMRVHEAVIAAGESESGVTIHEVNENYDEGKVRLQKRLTILGGWTAKDLETAVKKLEKATLVEFLNRLSERR